MEITGLPTESLYKFMAFSGLVIIFGTAAYAYKFLTAIGRQLINVKTEVDIFKYKSKKFHDEHNAKLRDIKSKASELLNTSLSELDKALSEISIGEDAGPIRPLSPEAQKLKEVMAESLQAVNKESLDLDIISAEISGKLNLLLFEIKQERLLKIGCAISGLVGLILAFYGFKHWAVMQVYIDQSVINEVISKSK